MPLFTRQSARASLFALLVVATPGVVRADGDKTPVRVAAATDTGSPVVSDASPGRAFQAARKAIKGPFQSFVNGPAVPTSLDDIAGQTIEVSGRIVGRATLPDNTTMLIVDCKGVSVNMSTPADAVPYWLDSGTTIRALATVPSSADLAASRSIMPLVASAPEFAVADADRADAAAADAAAKAAAITAAQSAVAQRNKALASRSASYQFRSEPLPGDAHPIAPLSAKLLAVYAPYRQFVAQNAPNLSPKMVDTITTSILYYSDQEKLDPRLVIAMILAESNFDPLSTSRTGAMGLSQLMPSTAAGLGVSNAYDPVQNIGAAVHILSGHVKQYGGADANGLVPINTLLLTMAAYNAGPGAVKRYGGVPPYAETQHYVRKVAALYRRMCGI